MRDVRWWRGFGLLCQLQVLLAVHGALHAGVLCCPCSLGLPLVFCGNLPQAVPRIWHLLLWAGSEHAGGYSSLAPYQRLL